MSVRIVLNACQLTWRQIMKMQSIFTTVTCIVAFTSWGNFCAYQALKYLCRKFKISTFLSHRNWTHEWNLFSKRRLKNSPPYLRFLYPHLKETFYQYLGVLSQSSAFIPQYDIIIKAASSAQYSGRIKQILRLKAKSWFPYYHFFYIFYHMPPRDLSIMCWRKRGKKWPNLCLLSIFA